MLQTTNTEIYNTLIKRLAKDEDLKRKGIDEDFIRLYAGRTYGNGYKESDDPCVEVWGYFIQFNKDECSIGVQGQPGIEYVSDWMDTDEYMVEVTINNQVKTVYGLNGLVQVIKQEMLNYYTDDKMINIMKYFTDEGYTGGYIALGDDHGGWWNVSLVNANLRKSTIGVEYFEKTRLFTVELLNGALNRTIGQDNYTLVNDTHTLDTVIPYIQTIKQEVERINEVEDLILKHTEPFIKEFVHDVINP